MNSPGQSNKSGADADFDASPSPTTDPAVAPDPNQLAGGNTPQAMSDPSGPQLQSAAQAGGGANNGAQSGGSSGAGSAGGGQQTDAAGGGGAAGADKGYGAGGNAGMRSNSGSGASGGGAAGGGKSGGGAPSSQVSTSIAPDVFSGGNAQVVRNQNQKNGPLAQASNDSGSGQSNSSSSNQSSSNASTYNSYQSSSGGSGGAPPDPTQMGQPPSPVSMNSPQAQQDPAHQQRQQMHIDDKKKQMTVSVERYVSVECRGDRLVVLPEGNGPPQELFFNGATASAVPGLLAAVDTRTKQWGYAGKDNYWRPVVSVQVAPGGEARYAELKAAMSDSDVEVRDRSAVATAPPPSKTPPKKSIFNWFRK